MHGPARRRVLGLVLACAGLVGTLAAGGVLAEAWYGWWTWSHSEESRRLGPPLATTSPRRVGPTSDGGSTPDEGERARTPGAAHRAGPAAPTARSGDAPPRGVPGMPAFVGSGPGVDRAPRVPAAATFEVAGAELRLLDGPGPGAHLILRVSLRNRSAAPSPPVVVGLAADWFERHGIIGAVPPVLDDRVRDDGYRYFEFPGPAPGAEAALELHILGDGGDVRAPAMRLAVRDAGSLGEVWPEVVAEGGALGPVRGLDIPRLGIRTAVVDTAWEPPPFVAGQIGTTAALGEGNAVLVGHRRGLAGDVFARLVGARLGDEVVASARGVDVRYVVSEILVLPGDDSAPIGPTGTPRLTLMTCTGAWNPLTGDYSHRLWVVAEPPDLARATLAAVARAGQAAATSEAARLRTDAALARAALSLLDAKRPGRP